MQGWKIATLALGTSIGLAVTLTSAQEMSVNQASFTDTGEARIPEGYRSWIFVGAPLTPNALNGGSAPFPEFHHVYVEPSAFDHYIKTGEWAEGSQIVKELTLVRTGDDCDAETGACSAVSGQGYFNGEFSGLELTVKDTTRFADEPGGWAYFSFGHHAPPYAETAAAQPTESCNSCHEVSAEADFVFTQFYPVLNAE